MMMGGSGMMEGIAKTILYIAVFVAILAFAFGIMITNNLVSMPLVEAEAAPAQAIVDQGKEQWAMQAPYYEQQLAADNAVMVAQSEQERQLIEANTAAEIARVEAETASYQVSLFNQRQMELAEHQQALVEADRWNQVLAIAGVVVVVALAVLLVLVVFLFVKQRLPRPARAAAYDPWQDPVFRRRQINQLRKMDEERNAELIRKSNQPVYPNGTQLPRRIRPSVN